jgi:hypothetical protein
MSALRRFLASVMLALFIIAISVKPMDIGEGKQIMSASNDQGNPILNNMGGRCQLLRLMDNGEVVANHGYCTYTDADNDQKCD